MNDDYSATEKLVYGFVLENSEYRNKKGEKVDRVVPLRVDIVDICEGDVEAAIFLAQLIFWKDRAEQKNGGWIYKSATDWYKETRLTDYKVKAITKKMVKLGFAETKNYIANGHNTRWFRLRLENIISALKNLYVDRENEKQKALDEITSALDVSSNALDEITGVLDETISALDDSSNSKHRVSIEYV